MKHFRISIAVTVVLMALAGWWGYAHGGIQGLLTGLWITGVLGVMANWGTGVPLLVARYSCTISENRPLATGPRSCLPFGTCPNATGAIWCPEGTAASWQG